MADLPAKMPPPVMVPMETVVQVTNLLLWIPALRLLDVMAEFDLSDEEARLTLTLARLVIRDLEEERSRVERA